MTLVVVLLVGVLAGFIIRLPYFTISPGGELAVQSRVKVDGAETFPAKGQVFLLFVRERARINVWRYVQARLDPDIDLFKEKEFLQGSTPEELNRQAKVDMANSKLAATKVALEEVGYKVPIDGLTVQGTVKDLPAARVLRSKDVIVSIDGKQIRAVDDLSAAIKRTGPDAEVSLGVRRSGQLRTIRVGTRTSEGSTVIGVLITPRYDFPVKVSINTNDIGGPSAGLAMSLAVIDNLTPGELTGGKRVAVTGTISDDGSVGEIGGIEQKAVAAKSAGAQLFIVPKCSDTTGRDGCLKDLARAKKRSGGTPVVPVANVDDALRALRKVGGDPVEQVGKAA
jgi:PDZ domain-containing protein